MNEFYNKYKSAENDIYKDIPIIVTTDKDLGNENLNKGLDWLCEDAHTVLDFGCGNGTFLFKCALRGVKEHIGIDFSDVAISAANKRAEGMSCGKYSFIEGSVEKLADIADVSVDGVILSNTIDNIRPEDSVKVLEEVKRILKPNGKVLIKLNPYITEEQIKECDIKTIKDNFLDDGLLLWNQTTEEWTALFSKYFNIYELIDVYYEDYDQHNRLFLVRK